MERYLLIPLCFAAILSEWVSVPKEEFQEYSTGLRRPVVSTTLVNWIGETSFTHVPQRLDWRTMVDHIPVQNQGACGSCWAFATTGPIEFLLRNASHSVDLSEQFLVSCNDAGYSCNNGGWWDFDTLLSSGLVPESCLPYVARDVQCTPTCAAYPHASIVRWGYVDRFGGVPSTHTMKVAMLTHGPLSVAVSVGNEFYSYRSGVFTFSHPGPVNHAVTMIGWDDDFQAWLVRNSWGAGWGMAGHMWIAYGVSNIGDGAAFVVLRAHDRNSPSPSLLFPSVSPVPSASPLVPYNTHCATAQTLVCSSSTFTVVGSTLNVPPLPPWSTCGDQLSGFRGVWFTFQLPFGVFRVGMDTVGSAFDTQLSLYFAENCQPQNWSCMATNDDISPENVTSQILLDQPMVGRYWLYLHGYGDMVGQYRLSLRCLFTHRCVDAVPVGCNQRVQSGTSGANTDPTIVDCTAAPSVAATAWFVLYVKPPIHVVVVDTAGSSFDTQLSIFVGPTCTQRQCLVSNDDVTGSRAAKVQFASAGTRYMIAVHGYGAGFRLLFSYPSISVAWGNYTNTSGIHIP